MTKSSAVSPARSTAFDVRRWGIRPKLLAVVLVPTIAALVLGGLRLQSTLSTSTSYSTLGSLADLLPQRNTLSSSLQAERSLTAGSLATRAAASAKASALASQRQATDTDINAFRAAVSGVDTSHKQALQTSLAATLASLNTVPALRVRADAGGTGAASVVADYGAIVAQLSGLTGLLETQQVDISVAARISSVQALTDAKDADGERQAIIYAAALRGSLSGTDVSDLTNAQIKSALAMNVYLTSLSDSARAAYNSGPGSTAINSADGIATRVVSVLSIANLGVTPDQWLSAATAAIVEFDRLLTNETAGLDSYINHLGRSASTDALVGAAIIYLIISLALLATLLVARSILRPLRQLRTGALEVAYGQLPATVRRLQDDAPPDGVLEVAPIAVSSSDEIGQVARAFDAVHSEAVLLAGQQALMRNNVNKMFINLSRRSQSLVERQLRLIDELEASEQDADQLANLFKLDHLATRMRRNDENLLVLAGDEGARRRSEPVPMLDVLRAASGEVEQYNRVQLDAQPGFDLIGTAVNDVVHLVAELVENATTFSSPSTMVWVRSRSLGVSGEMLVEVEDHGIGMGPAEFAAANEKLATPVGMDISMSRLMGLFVVGRLARRHRIDVQLRPSPYGGVTAFVRLPAALITAPKIETPEPVAVMATTPVINETSPIFEALQSEWFTPRTPMELPVPAAVGYSNGTGPGSPVQSPAAPPPVIPPPVSPIANPTRNWISPGDEGWRAAATLGTPERSAAELTSAGLPIRVPGRNLMPGSADPTNGAAAPNGAPAIRGPEPTPRLSAGLSSYQRGISRARTTDPTAAAAAAAAEDSSADGDPS